MYEEFPEALRGIINPEAQAEVDAMEAHTMKHSDACREAMIREGKSKKTNRAHARAELEALRQQVKESARLDSYIRVYIQNTVKDRSDVIQVLQGLKSLGIKRHELADIADTVWPDH